MPNSHPVRLPRHLKAYGPDAFLLNWEARIDPAISAGVHAYAHAVSQHPAVRECVPAYASLLVRYDREQCAAASLREWLYELRPAPLSRRKVIRHDLPVCYDGPDLVRLCERLSLSPAELIALHSGQEYLVYQSGFLPGFAFLGQTDERLACVRHPSPRARVPAGAVGLAGRQTGVYPSASPGGWQLIGRCPTPLLRAHADFARLHPGDRVRFYAVDAATFLQHQQSPPQWPVR